MDTRRIDWGKVNKLPGWARTLVGDLSRALDTERKEHTEALLAPVSNTALIRDETEGPGLVYLPDDARIAFFTDKVKADERRVSRSGFEVSLTRSQPHRPITLRIATWHLPLAVYPSAANAVHVLEVPRGVV